MQNTGGGVDVGGDALAGGRLQSAPPYGLHPRAGELRGLGSRAELAPFRRSDQEEACVCDSPTPPPAAPLYYPVGFMFPGYYMAQGGDPRSADGGDCDGGGGGGLAMGAGQHSSSLGGPPHSIDALKARVMDAGPGEVKALIAASRLPLR